MQREGKERMGGMRKRGEGKDVEGEVEVEVEGHGNMVTW